jgi:hypothetical protein
VIEKTPWPSAVSSSSPGTSCRPCVPVDSTGSESPSGAVEALSEGLGGTIESSERKRSFAAYKTPMPMR